MNKHILAYAKAYAALIGSAATALLGIYTTDTQLGKLLTVVTAICSAVAVARIPNTPDAKPAGEGGFGDPALLLLVLTFVGVLLLLCGVHLR